MGWRVTGGGKENQERVGVVESDQMLEKVPGFGDRVGGIEVVGGRRGERVQGAREGVQGRSPLANKAGVEVLFLLFINF